MSSTNSHFHTATAAQLAMTQPFAIQPHGCLIVFDDAMDQVIQISANCRDFLGLSVATSIQMSAQQLLGISLTKRLKRSLVGEQRLRGALTVRWEILGARREYHLDAYRASGRILVELENASGKIGSRLLSALNQHLIEITSADHHHHLFQALVEGFQALTGHAQVYLVQLLANGTGHVLAECKTAKENSFLGCSFPSTVISPALRARLRLNPLRSVPDTALPSVALHPEQSGANNGTDLARGMLQATSEHFCRYLESLGATDFLGAALYSDETLWGMVVGHHTESLNKTPARRNAARALVQAATQRLFLLESRDRIKFAERVDESRILLSGTLNEANGCASLLAVYGEQWIDVFQADGIALVLDSEVSLMGATLSAEDTRTLLIDVSERMGSRSVWHTHSLHCVNGMPTKDHTSGVSGVLVAALPSNQIRNSWIVLFRNERIETRFWIAPEEKQGGVSPAEGGTVPVRRERLRHQSVPWGKAERSAIKDIAEDLSVAVANTAIQELNERLEALAHTDALTQVNNRRSIEIILTRELETAERHDLPLSVLLVDVDHFKAVNDTHGHELGDLALEKVASTLRSHLRISDHLGRWGGEEFVVVATHTAAGQAEEFARRLCEAVTAMPVAGIGHLTVSIGIAERVPGQTVSELISSADQAMYLAKEQGRNRAVRHVDRTQSR